MKIHAELSVGMKLDFWGFIKLSQDLHQDLLDPSRQDDKWFKVISKLENRDRIGSSLNLRCAKHPRDDGMVKTAEDFDRKALHGGCQRDCDTLLPRCGHRCHLKCHPFDPEHKDGIRASKQPFSVHPPSLTARMSCATTFAAGLGRHVLICIHAPGDASTLAYTALSPSPTSVPSTPLRLLFGGSEHFVLGIATLGIGPGPFCGVGGRALRAVPTTARGFASSWAAVASRL